jgi:hypothetical protein
MHSNAQIGRTARALAAIFLATTIGCTTVKMTGTPRTGTEQLLLTGTWDGALSRVDFSPLAGARVFVDAQYVSAVDKDWVVSSIRRTMAEQGVLLENNKDKAQVILEAALGAYGTDERDRKFGLPGVSLVPSLTTGAAVTSNGSANSLTFSQTNQQDAVVKASLFAYDAKTGRLVWESAPLLNAQGVRDHFLIGSGPYRLSSRPEVEQYPSESSDQTRKQFFRRWIGNQAPGTQGTVQAPASPSDTIVVPEVEPRRAGPSPQSDGLAPGGAAPAAGQAQSAGPGSALEPIPPQERFGGGRP